MNPNLTEIPILLPLNNFVSFSGQVFEEEQDFGKFSSPVQIDSQKITQNKTAKVLAGVSIALTGLYLAWHYTHLPAYDKSLDNVMVSRRTLKSKDDNAFIGVPQDEAFFRAQGEYEHEHYGDTKNFKKFGSLVQKSNSNFIPKIRETCSQYQPGHQAHAEDEHTWTEGEYNGVKFWGVFDGHGGCTAGKFLKENLAKIILNQPLIQKNTPQALIDGIRLADQQYTHYLGPKAGIQLGKGGATCTVALLDKNIMTFGWLGDSDVHLYRKSTTEAEICFQGHDVYRPDMYSHQGESRASNNFKTYGWDRRFACQASDDGGTSNSSS
eukprot:GHVP01034856.1.p1 GENE.GHVP01034856.1~~GHVP01034856.1.p1  ORF type:complete len:324 (+),score=40.66 GHVP01034856.1:2003-2974(+)